MSDPNIPKQDNPGGPYEPAPFPPGLEYMMHPVASIGASNELLVHPDDDSLVIRAAHLDNYYPEVKKSFYKNEFNASPVLDKEVIEKVLGDCKLASELYKELRDLYGIAMPEFKYVIGEANWQPEKPDITTSMRHTGNQGALVHRQEGAKEPMLYTIAQKIDARTSLSHLQEDDKHPTATDYHNLFTGFTRYLADKYTSGGSFISDFGGSITMLEQCSFGHIDPDEEDKIYWHDLDPKAFDMQQIETSAGQLQLGAMLYQLGFDLRRVIHRYPDQDFSSTVEDMSGTITKLLDQHPDQPGTGSMAQALAALQDPRLKK